MDDSLRLKNLSDLAFLSAFEKCEITANQWDHYAHVRMAYLYLKELGLSRAAGKVRDGINRLNDVVGVRKRGYHETITMAFLRLLNCRLRENESGKWNLFIDSNQDLLSPDAIGVFYSIAAIDSPAAKSHFIAPDKASLPGTFSIISGGQTGVDRAGLDVAIEAIAPHGGWCPKGRKSEDGPISNKYSLTETPSDDYAQRTEWNVRDSSCTLILTWGEPTGGTKLTAHIAKDRNKPFMIVDLQKADSNSSAKARLLELKPEILNIAGPRESCSPGRVYKEAFQFLSKMMEDLTIEQ